MSQRKFKLEDLRKMMEKPFFVKDPSFDQKSLNEVVKFKTKEEIENHAFFLALKCLFVPLDIGEGSSLNKQIKLAKVHIDWFKEIFEKDCPDHKKFGVCFEEIVQRCFFDLMANKILRTEALDFFKNRIEEIKAEFSNYWANAGT